LVTAGPTLDHGLFEPFMAEVATQSPYSIPGQCQSLPPRELVPPSVGLPTTDVSLDAQPDVTAHIEESAPVEALTPELQLVVPFEMLHCLDMAEKGRSLSAEELDLIEFLIAQVASLSSSLAVEVEAVGKAVVAESPYLPPVTCEVMSL
jgi:hypothetical protein